jgi:hypothetical protein
MSASRACPSRLTSTASWSISPVRTPAHSHSTRRSTAASRKRSISRAPAIASAASATAADSAADDDRPAPIGRSPVIVRRMPGSGPAERSISARVPRT